MKDIVLAPFGQFYFRDENSARESTETHFELSSADKPKLLFLVNEADSADNLMFFRLKSRVPEDSSIDYKIMDKLNALGEH